MDIQLAHDTRRGLVQEAFSSTQAWQTDCRANQSDCVDHVDLAGFSGFV